MINHDEQHKKFTLEDPKGTSYLEYAEDDQSVTVLHTVVPDALSGQGIAARLAQAAANYARTENKEIHSECAYMTAWLKRHS